MKLYKKLPTLIDKILRSSVVLLVLAPLIAPTASAFDPGLYRQTLTPFYDLAAGSSSACFGSGSLERFMQAETEHEGGGKPTANSGNGAYGKYQYIDSTWRSTLKSYYNPIINGVAASELYPHASDAPEAIQDAVTYIKYSALAAKYQGSVWQMSIVHYYPAALDNLGDWMDKIPRPDAGNKLTIRQYANNIVKSFNDGTGSDIKIIATQAPDFQSWLQKAGLANIPQLYAVENNEPPTGFVGSGANQTCGNNTAITQMAIDLSWPDASHGSTPKPEYSAAINQYNPGQPPDDCGVFVATVMRASGADSEYPVSGTSNQASYLKSSSKYTILENLNDISQLQPGDILIIPGDSGGGTSGHTLIYLGDQPGGNQASASLNKRAANLGTLKSLVDPSGRGTYMVARLNQ